MSVSVLPGDHQFQQAYDYLRPTVHATHVCQQYRTDQNPDALYFHSSGTKFLHFGVQQAPVCFDLEKQWSPARFQPDPHNIRRALLTNDDNNSAIVTITDADFLINQSAIDGHTDNLTFALNSIEWLADNSGLIQLRNKFTTFPVLEPVGDTSREVLKYINFLLPILIILGIRLLPIQT